MSNAKKIEKLEAKLTIARQMYDAAHKVFADSMGGRNEIPVGEAMKARDVAKSAVRILEEKIEEIKNPELGFDNQIG